MPILSPINFFKGASSLLKSLVANYEMTEAYGTRFDSTLGANHLTTATATAPGSVLTSAPGLQTYSASFSQAFNNSLSRASTTDLQGGGGISFTLEAWFFGNLVDDTLIAKHSGSTNEYFLFSSGGNLIMRVYTTVTNYDAGVPNPSVAAWHHVLGWFDAGANTVNIQVDGGAIVTTPTTGTITSGNSQFVVGNFQGGGLLWNGRIGPVRKFNAVLNVGERAFLFNGGNGAAWPFSSVLGPASTLQFAAFPILVRLVSGLSILYWNRGDGHSLNSAVVEQQSSSDFVAWTRGPNLESGAHSSITAATQIANGNILRFRAVGLTPSIANSVYVSADNGSSWDGGTSIPDALSDWMFTYGRPYQLAGGRILLPAYGANSGESMRAILLYSDDNGATWALLSTIAYDGTATLDYNETSIINTGGNNWLAVVRADLFNTQTTQNFRYATSADNGATWSALSDIGFDGNAPELVYGGADLFMFYRNRTSTRTSYRKSVDNGANWGAEVIVYQDTEADCAYPSAVYDGTNICLAYYRTSGLSVNVWKKAAASM